MEPGNAGQVFPIFFAVWMLLGLFSAAFFFLSKNAALKRQVWPPFVVLVGILFLGFVWAMGFPLQTMYVAVPAVALTTALNLRTMQFCDACGATVLSQNPFTKPAYCSKCGAKLNDSA